MQTIDITTSQNVTIEYELAPIKERILAFIIDGLIVITVISAISMMSVNLVSFFPLFFIIYQLLSEIIGGGQSYGKLAFGLRVVRVDGEDPSLSDFLLRAFFHLIDSLLSVGVVASILISSTAKNQRLGDIAANTTVIKVKLNSRFYLEDILKINTIDDYEPVFLEVKNLSEQDMLLIKNVIGRYQKYPNKAHSSAVNEVVEKVMKLLDIQNVPQNKLEFLKTLIRDYIVLTR